MLVRFDASNITRKALFLRGIPDELVIGGAFPPDPVWITRFNSYKNSVTTGGFAIKKLGTTALPPVPILNVSNAGIVETSTAHGFLKGQRVHMTGVKVDPKVAFSFVIIDPITTFTFAIADWAPRGNVFPIKGFVRRAVYEPVPIISGIWERVVKKSTGRPFDSPVGRRRRVK